MITSTPISVLAEDKPERPEVQYLVPQGTTCSIDGVEFKAYSFDEYKILKHIFTDYSGLWKYALSLEDDIISYKVEIARWKDRYELWKEAYEDEKDRSNIYFKAYKEEHAFRLRSEKGERMTRWIPWTLVVVESIMFGVVSVMK